VHRGSALGAVAAPGVHESGAQQPPGGGIEDPHFGPGETVATLSIDEAYLDRPSRLVRREIVPIQGVGTLLPVVVGQGQVQVPIGVVVRPPYPVTGPLRPEGRGSGVDEASSLVAEEVVRSLGLVSQVGGDEDVGPAVVVEVAPGRGRGVVIRPDDRPGGDR
jgi:hypothetical protein